MKFELRGGGSNCVCIAERVGGLMVGVSRAEEARCGGLRPTGGGEGLLEDVVEELVVDIEVWRWGGD